MVLHVALLVESLAAIVTLERFLPGVGSLVEHERRPLLKCLPTLPTDVRTFPGVDAVVDRQVGPVDERLVTQRTLVGFVAEVDQFVTLQMGPEVECLVAGSALERTLDFIVPDGDVLPEAATPSERLPA